LRRAVPSAQAQADQEDNQEIGNDDAVVHRVQMKF
jgi:hypothetical protein